MCLGLQGVTSSHCIEMIFEKVGMMDTVREMWGKSLECHKVQQIDAATLNHMRNHMCASENKLELIIFTPLNIASESRAGEN